MTDNTFEIELVAMAHGGRALGRHDKKTVFIPYAIPGEIVQARITEDKGRVVFAEGLKLIAASADRVYPRCAHFGPGRCGGCHWQHIDYAAQLLLKQDILADQLARIGGYDDADVKAVIPAVEQWQYNYHASFDITPEGKPGLPGFDDRPAFPIDECHIIHPDLLSLYDTFDLDFSSMTRLKLQMGTDGGQMAILYLDNEEDAPELTADFPISVNVVLPDNEPVSLIGDSHSLYQVNGRVFRVTAGSAFRANVGQVHRLAEVVLALLDARPGDAVLDLYAGVGVFSAYIAPLVSLVTLIESYPPAVTDADDNLAEFDNVDIVEGTLEEVLPTLDETDVIYNAAVLDPPADGLSVEVQDRLGELKIPRLIYVSSDPATLARDAKRLANHGYTLGTVQPIDLAPQTYYIDSVAVFTR